MYNWDLVTSIQQKERMNLMPHETEGKYSIKYVKYRMMKNYLFFGNRNNKIKSVYSPLLIHIRKPIE